MKMTEVKEVQCLRVQSLEEPFEGVYLGPIQGKLGTNYRFFSESQEFVIYGTKVLHNKLAQVEAGHAVRITFLDDHTTKTGGKYFDVKVEVSEEPVEGFDLT